MRVRYFSAKAIIMAVALVAVVAGCQSSKTEDGVDINYLSCIDFSDYLAYKGVKIDYVQPLDATKLKASEAMAVSIGGHEIGVYKFDTDIPKQLERVNTIANNGYVYLIGMKFLAKTRGSFVFIGVDEHPMKAQLTELIGEFE